MNTQFSMPPEGSHVAITFEFPSYVIGSVTVNKTTITGIVEKATKWTLPNTVRLITDFDSPVRVREVSLERITNIEYSDGRVADTQIAMTDTKTWIVQGSRGSKYSVVRSKNTWSCSCPGFQFRKSCKHIKECQDA